MSNPKTIPDLDRFAFFHGLPPAFLQIWKRNFNRMSFTKRQRLVFPSSCSDVIFFVLSGKVKIAYTSEDGKEFAIAILSAGEVYSEHSLALATAIEKTEVLYVSMADFKAMMDECPELARHLVRLLGKILRLTNDLIVDLAFRETSSRLARVFRRTMQGKNDNAIYLTHEELASLSGSTRQTINEILRHWEQQGIVALHRGYVVLLLPERLWEKISHEYS
ncbi:Crp/Fnr family transcriptional regulator [Desulfitobacterium chlororespirans]|uniref:Transcriptional regulator, Crp/Fnr family n=1 Tax=Desulfitobacterium chlororespirans DSM 11544 TaxID=1121395 RepID=A0A1M7UZI2_9FIRM|nr:Crp/Fnr family transcriptional regulator [Desulfitobacterium chlororespirans]SHN88364.1 transcriptional regulator, Crp/Fnr family [Desulfitobacterium chlororespirans DSM 11544]